MVFKRYSIGTKGPKVCQENIPHTITPPPAWTAETSQDGSMLSCSLRQILTLPSEYHQTHQTRQRFSNLLLFNSGESVWIVSSVSCSYLTGVSPGVVFCCWSPSASGFDVLCVQRCILYTLVVTSGYLSYCCLSIISNQSAHSPLNSDINKVFSSTQLTLTGYFLFFRSFSVNLEMVVCENPSRSAVFEILRPVRLHQQPFHVQSHLNPLSSPFWCSVWTSASRLHHI